MAHIIQQYRHLKDQAHHGHVKNNYSFSVFVGVLLVLIYVLCRTYVALVGDCSWGEMDWDRNGTTSLFELIESSDIGKRVISVKGEDCTEYFSLKDGLPLNTVYSLTGNSCKTFAHDAATVGN